MVKKRKKFSDWDLEELETTFALQPVKSLPALESWTNADATSVPNDSNALEIERLRLRLESHLRGWNELELRERFIAPLLELVDFENEKVRPFSGRELSAEVGDFVLYGVVDWALASGRYRPGPPYVCLHEYKPSVGKDPLPQLLSALLAARALNENFSDALYGVCVIEANWSFVVLTEGSYGVSRTWNATLQEDISKIYAILLKLKELINLKLQVISN